MSGETTRGARDVRAALRAYLQTRLSLLVPYLRDEWQDSAAFPPAGVEEGSDPVPTGTNVQAVIGRPLDRYPLVQIEVTNARIERAGSAVIDGSDSIEYFVTYSTSALVWITVAPPESLPLEEEREYVTDVRDDLQTAMRYALLDQQPPGPFPMLVLPNSYREDYGEPSSGKGQRWTVGGRARFDLRAQERLTRPSLATVPDGQTLIFDVEAKPMPPIDHPAL